MYGSPELEIEPPTKAAVVVDDEVELENGEDAEDASSTIFVTVMNEVATAVCVSVAVAVATAGAEAEAVTVVVA